MQLLVVNGKQEIKKKYETLRKDLTVQKRMYINANYCLPLIVVVILLLRFILLV